MPNVKTDVVWHLPFGIWHLGLPAAAVGLVPAGRAAPDGVHPEHLGAAALAEDLVGPGGDAFRGGRNREGLGRRPVRHRRIIGQEARPSCKRVNQADFSYEFPTLVRYLDS